MNRTAGFRRLFDDIRGGTGFIEYLILVGVIAIGGVAGFRLFASSLAAKADHEASAIDVGSEAAPERQSVSALGRQAVVTTGESDDGANVSDDGERTTVFAAAGIVLVLGLGFTLWLRAKNARGELSTASAPELSTGDRGGP
jgi:Flp pilus assembly pilin Flp